MTGQRSRRGSAATLSAQLAYQFRDQALALQSGAEFSPSDFMKHSVTALRAYLKARNAVDGESAFAATDARENSDKSLAGYVFQKLVSECLIRAEISPFYPEAFVTFVPVAQYDVIIPTRREGIVNLSVKTTLRERWKQAEFEGIALKRVHRRSRIYVVNDDPKGTATRRRSIDQCEAIDDFIYCASPDFDAMIEAIRSWEPTTLGEVPVIATDGRRHAVDLLLGEGLNTQRVRIPFLNRLDKSDAATDIQPPAKRRIGDRDR